MATQFTHPAEHIETIDISRFGCIDGQLLERPWANSDHSNVQNNLAYHLRPLIKESGWRGVPISAATG